MPKIIRILRSCYMKIFCTFSTVNISKLNFWLVICIAKNFIWTTLKVIFSIFILQKKKIVFSGLSSSLMNVWSDAVLGWIYVTETFSRIYNKSEHTHTHSLSHTDTHTHSLSHTHTYPNILFFLSELKRTWSADRTLALCGSSFLEIRSPWNTGRETDRQTERERARERERVRERERERVRERESCSSQDRICSRPRLFLPRSPSCLSLSVSLSLSPHSISLSVCLTHSLSLSLTLSLSLSHSLSLSLRSAEVKS